MNILVTGANGQLGNELRLAARGSRHNFVFTDVVEQPGAETVRLDICDIDTVRLTTESEIIDVIVNCAAFTNVDRAEDDRESAMALNRDAPRNLAIVAQERGARLIHISTDYVFPGTGSRPLRESDRTDPKSVYGSTKLAGEAAVLNSGCDAIIIRTAWLYSPFGRNFVKTIRELASARKEIRVVNDQVGTPTYAADLAGFIVHIIDSGQLDKTGIYHYSDEGVTSWFDFAHEIVALSGGGCEVQPCSSSEFPSKVNRPHYSVLDKSLVRNTFGVKVPYWRDSLADCIKRLDGK